MAITKDAGRQAPLVARVHFTFEDFDAGAVTATTVFKALDMPAGSIVTGGALVITTAFSGPTAATIAVGFGGAANKFLADTNILALGRTVLTVAGGTFSVQFDAADTIDLDVAMSVAVATVGAGYLDVEYLIDGRAIETQPINDNL